MRVIRECKIEDCERSTGQPGTARGLCSKHYNRWLRHGDVEYKSRCQGETLEEHYNYYTPLRPEVGCWEWQGYFYPSGYGMLHRGDGGNLKAHRVAFELFNGPLPDGHLVRHTCDNPPCVRPSHLLSGTHKDNSDDMWSRGRAHLRNGERNPKSKLTESDVVLIRDIIPQGVYSRSFLAKHFGVSNQTISSIANYKTWMEVSIQAA